MTTYKIPVLNDRVPQITDSGFYGDIRFDPDDQVPFYIGTHTDNGAATSDTGWKVLKFTYSGTTGSTTRIQLAYGAWDNRASLFV